MFPERIFSMDRTEPPFPYSTWAEYLSDFECYKAGDSYVCVSVALSPFTYIVFPSGAMIAYAGFGNEQIKKALSNKTSHKLYYTSAVLQLVRQQQWAARIRRQTPLIVDKRRVRKIANYHYQIDLPQGASLVSYEACYLYEKRPRYVLINAGSREQARRVFHALVYSGKLRSDTGNYKHLKHLSNLVYAPKRGDANEVSKSSDHD